MPKCPRPSARRRHHGITWIYSSELIEIFRLNFVHTECTRKSNCTQSICQLSMSTRIDIPTECKDIWVRFEFFVWNFSFSANRSLECIMAGNHLSRVILLSTIERASYRYSGWFFEWISFYRMRTMHVASALMQLRLTNGKDGKGKNDSIHVPFGLYFFCLLFSPQNSICAPKMAICMKSYHVQHIEKHVEIYTRSCIIQPNRVDAVVWAAAILWLLDWMEQLTNAVSGCHAVARFRFFTYILHAHWTRTQSRARITGCLLHVRLCCSPCKHNFERSRHWKHRCDYVCDLCGRRVHATAAIYKFITRTRTLAWMESEREWNERRKHLFGCRFCSSHRNADWLVAGRCPVPVMAHAFVYLRQVHTFTVREAKSVRFMCLLNSNQINIADWSRWQGWAICSDKCAKARTHCEARARAPNQPYVPRMPRASSSIVISTDGLFPLFTDCVSFSVEMTDDDIRQE